jgi:AraC-like DNA-binding protein
MKLDEVAGNKIAVFGSAEKLGFLCNRLDTSRHRHFAIQLTLALDDPFTVQLADEEPCEQVAALIPSEMPHRFTSFSGYHFFLLIDPLSPLGLRLESRTKMESSVPSLPSSLIEKIWRSARTIRSHSAYEKLYNQIVSLVQDWSAGFEKRELDDRVRQAIHQCQQSQDKKMSLSRLARLVHLSESRLVHLFKQETGVTVRRYLKWLRTLDALNTIQSSDTSLTDVAHEVGFSDQAHFTRTFREMFGISPSFVLRKAYSQ